MLAPVLSAGDGSLAVAVCQQPGGPLASTSRSTRASLHTRDRGRCRVDGEAPRARDTLGVQLALADLLEEVLLRALSMCAGSGRWPDSGTVSSRCAVFRPHIAALAGAASRSPLQLSVKSLAAVGTSLPHLRFVKPNWSFASTVSVRHAAVGRCAKLCIHAIRCSSVLSDKGAIFASRG